MIIFPSSKIKNTHELRLKVAEYLEKPANDIDAFVPYHEIEDDDESNDPRFTIIFTSKKNLGKLKSDRVLQTDATYRLNWMGFPVFVVGKDDNFIYHLNYLLIYLQGPLLPLAGSLQVVLFLHLMKILRHGPPSTSSFMISTSNPPTNWVMVRRPSPKLATQSSKITNSPDSCVGLMYTRTFFLS